MSHHRPLVGMARVYTVEMMRLITCRVKVKSRASFERPTITVIASTENTVSMSHNMEMVQPIVVSYRTECQSNMRPTLNGSPDTEHENATKMKMIV